MFWPQFLWSDRDESNHRSIARLLLLGRLPNITPKQIYLILNQSRNSAKTSQNRTGICVQGGIFANFFSFSLLSNILNFRNCVNLHKIFQWIMFSLSCTIKGTLF